MSPRPEYEAALLKLSVPELKNKCKESNIPCTGKKSELVLRLIRPEEHQKGVKKPKDKNAPSEWHMSNILRRARCVTQPA